MTDLKVAADGSMYYITYWPGAIYHVTFNTSTHRPVASASADVTKGVEPLVVHFSSAGSSDPDGDALTYLWSFGDGTTSTQPNPTKTYATKGVFTARLTVTANGDQSTAQPIVVQVGLAPDLIVSAPTEGQLYRAGDTITYNAFAKDAAGFDLNDANIKTEVRLHHGTHFHPFAGPLTGRAGSFTIPATGEASADTSYEVKVTATDTNGLFTTKTVTVVPRKSDLSFRTQPAGLGVVIDGVPVSTPRTVTGVEGFRREVDAPMTAVALDGTPLQFAGWSDGKSIRHTITTPQDDTTYTATYQPSVPFTATYYDNTSFSGSPVLTRQDQNIDFAWGGGSPAAGIPDDGFSVRWSKAQYFGAGTYRFSVLADDGVRLFVDGRRVVSQWAGPANATFDTDLELGEGMHTVTMEYVEHGGDATARLHWSTSPTQPTGTWHAEYWNAVPGINAIPATSAEVTAEEEVVDHDWGEGSPGTPIAVNHFVGRWTRTFSVAPGSYEFAATADDGVRLTVDGVRVIDKWIDQSPTTYRTTLDLDGGPHHVTMEYYENGGGAVAKLSYAKVGDAAAETPWHASFWNTPEGGIPDVPTRAADLQRDDHTLAFDWVEGSPGAGIAADHFVGRWTRSVVLSAGLYRFSGGRDDGIRVYLDNAPIVDHWTTGNEDFSVEKVVSGGTHDLRVDYFESSGGARAELTYERLGDVVPTGGSYDAEYFGNRTLSGTPALTRKDDTVDFTWGGGAPGDGVPADSFSARWTKAMTLDEAATYAFTVTGDDGVRLFVDGDTILDRWVQQGATTYTALKQLSPGTHTVVLEYFEAGGDAVAKLSYARTAEPPPPPTEPFQGEYFANSTLSGAPALTRTDSTLDFDWGEGPPNAALPANQFSARWTRTMTYEAGTYRFSVTGDDGIRLFVDGVPVVNGWFYQAPTTFTADIALAAGPHTVAVEYFEWTGGAVAKFSQAKLAGP